MQGPLADNLGEAEGVRLKSLTLLLVCHEWRYSIRCKSQVG